MAKGKKVRKNSSYKKQKTAPVINSRAELVDYNKIRISQYPLSLRWFKFFKYGAIPLQAAFFLYGVAVCVISLITSFGAEVRQELSDTTFAFFTAYNAVMILLNIAAAVFCFIMLRQLSELTEKTYRILKIFLWSTASLNALYNAAAELMRGLVFPETMDFSRIAIIAYGVIFMGIWLYCNLKYFRIRKSLFEAPQFIT